MYYFFTYKGIIHHFTHLKISGFHKLEKNKKHGIMLMGIVKNFLVTMEKDCEKDIKTKHR